MFTPDNSKSMIDAAVAAAKASVQLDPESQSQPDDGHRSAPDPGSVDQSAAVPGGSPGK